MIEEKYSTETIWIRRLDLLKFIEKNQNIPLSMLEIKDSLGFRTRSSTAQDIYGLIDAGLLVAVRNPRGSTIPSSYRVIDQGDPPTNKEALKVLETLIKTKSLMLRGEEKGTTSYWMELGRLEAYEEISDYLNNFDKNDSKPICKERRHWVPKITRSF